MKKRHLILLVFILFSTSHVYTQALTPDGGGEYRSAPKPNCLSEEERIEVKQLLNENMERLKKQGLFDTETLNTNVSVSFDWPLRKTAGLSFNSYYATNNYVDQDPGEGLLDYHCDARTYNGHRGTDIDTWPYPWYIYDHDFVEVIAAEAGTVLGKRDGNDDDHCSCSGLWNAVYIGHADGSRAWYGHLKKNSVTTKEAGDTVEKGEYLGVVASSGCSTQPHLHFEVYDSEDNLVDPYSGACNDLNEDSWWTTEPANREPTLNAVLTHSDIPVHGCPGTNEDPKLLNIFLPGQTLYMATYYHDQLAGDMSTLRLRRPDGSVFDTWTHTSNATYTKSWWYWYRTLPLDQPYGTWKFEVDYQGETVVHEFQYLSALPELLVSPVLYLQGAYDPATGLMRDDLRRNGDLPLSEPFTSLGFTHVGGGGSEGVAPSVFDISGENAIVDWVFLELRDKTEHTNVLATRSALLQRDGDIVDVDGSSPVSFANLLPDDYYLAIKHRNHLGVMSASTIACSNIPTVMDFTNEFSDTYGGVNGIAALQHGELGLFSGDFNYNGQIQNQDYVEMISSIGLSGYLAGDFNLNGQVQNSDLQEKLLPNIGRGEGF